MAIDAVVAKSTMPANSSKTIHVTVNGIPRASTVEARTLLVSYLREHLELTGTHIGCDTRHCGACTVLVDGKAVKSCTMLAVQADGCEVTTVEGLEMAGNSTPSRRGSRRSTACSAASAPRA